MQTPAHDSYNSDILSLMHSDFETIVEVGCSRGTLAKAYRSLHSCDKYIGIEIDIDSAMLARRHCDLVMNCDVEKLDALAWESLFPSELWIFGDSLEHLVDPWTLLSRLRTSLRPGCRVIACIPNAQHWSVQARLATGLFVYEQSGLLDRSHLRWFTRKTICSLFQNAGFSIVGMSSRIFDEPQKDSFLPFLAVIADIAGQDPDEAVTDAIPLQYVVDAVVPH